MERRTAADEPVASDFDGVEYGVACREVRGVEGRTADEAGAACERFFLRPELSGDLLVLCSSASAPSRKESRGHV